MTYEQIDALLFDDYKDAMASRIWGKMDPQPEDQPELTDAELQAEFDVYKNELRAVEDERLRKQDLTDRFNALKDMRASFHPIHSEPNPALWFKNLLEGDHAEAEAKMVELELKDDQLSNSKEKKFQDYINARNEKYAEKGATRDLILEALWEFIKEGRPEKMDQLQVIREQVKVEVPKPE